MKKHLYHFLYFLFILNQLSAQQTSIFTQSADEFGLNNPAGLSFEEIRKQGTTLTGYYRSQWWDGEGYPRTQALSWFDGQHERYLWGTAVIADKIGETRTLGLQGRYAHSIAKGLKIGISAAGISEDIDIEKLDFFDTGDEVALAADKARWQLSVSAGAFYKVFEPKRVWNWFAGLAVRRVFPLDELPGGGEVPAETDLLAQGGFERLGWWSGGLRLSLHQPSAFDVYVRKYLTEKELFFLGGIFTSDVHYQTAGLQAGYEKELGSNDAKKSKHFLTIIFGFSKPLSNYIAGNNLIFDGRVVWTLEHNNQ